MDGPKLRFTAVFMVAMLAGMFFIAPAGAAEDLAGRASDETVRDGRVIGVLTVPDQTYERTWTHRQGEWSSLAVDCGQCTVSLELDDVENDVTSFLNLQATTDGTARLSIVSPVQEFVSYSLIQTVDEQHPTVRPSPGESMEAAPSWMCDQNNSCTDLSKGLDSIPSTEFSPGEFILGVLDQEQAEYIAIAVDAGTTMELQLLHATSDLLVEVYMQTSIETLLTQSLVQSGPLQVNQHSESTYWHAEEEGRMILKISSDAPNTAYSLKRTLHTFSQEAQMIDLNSTPVVDGHHQKSMVIETTETEALIIDALHRNATGQVEQLVAGQWLSAVSLELTVDEPTHIYPYPNASAFRLQVEGERFALELGKMPFDDINSNLEAPSVRPSGKTLDNTSWPLLPAPSEPLEGELTLAIHDTADVYKIEINGFEESVHLLQIKIVSEDLDMIQLEMWDLDQDTWESIDFRLVGQVNGKVQSALELSRGTHFVRVSHVDVENATNHTRGDHIAPIKYVITAVYTMIKEGNEPYFPPDETTVMWGEVARWVMGLLFLAPCAYVAVTFASNRKLAREMSEKTEQLKWFQSQMDSGEKSPFVLRKSLDKSLQAIAQLDWATACATWGATDAEHRTEGISMAVWKLDQRLAKSEGALPLMVAIHVIEGHWELAALRFDAPEGEAWEVVNVEPKFLFRGEEIFVDTMRGGNLTFLTLELKGSADHVDVELNGRCNGEPSAARMPQTISMTNKEEE